LLSKFLDGLHLAGLVRDIGKISVPIEFLTRPVKLSEAELNVIRQHAAAGYDVLKGIDWPWPRPITAKRRRSA
jgi:HD-GYP domain-containing protein (c-di-GMP phosphodiesterase class II)